MSQARFLRRDWNFLGLALALAGLLSPCAFASVVTNNSEINLRQAIDAGGLVTFAVDGTIALTQPIRLTTSVALDGGIRQIAIDGQGLVRLFEVAPGVSLTLTNLTLTRGFATNGGAIYNAGAVTAVGCRFLANASVATSNPGPPPQVFPSLGGSVFNGGEATFFECSFVSNRTTGGQGTITASSGRVGLGGAIYSSNDLIVARCTFSRNLAQGGDGVGDPGSSTGAGALGAGGAIYNEGSATILDTTFKDDEAKGGHGGNITFAASGQGGAAAGGAICNGGTLAVTNSTFYSNTARGGDYGVGRFGPFLSGNGLGGAISSQSGTVVLSSSTVAENAAIGGFSTGLGLGGGIQVRTNAAIKLHNSIVAASRNGSDASGALVDLGYNLCSDSSCNLTNSGSLNATDPRLGPLTNNGGLTLTMALQPPSPAIDAGDPGQSPSVDQRGIPRPQHQLPDMGATEFEDVWPRVIRWATNSIRSLEGQPALQLTIICTGNPEGTVMVRCRTMDESARAPDDYGPIDQMVTFAPGETTRMISVPIVDDSVLEENETFRVTLSAVSGPLFLDLPSDVVVTIVDKNTPSGVCSAAELQVAINGGGEITFGCNGTIFPTNTLVITNTVSLDGRLRSVTLSGSNSTRLFQVQAGGSLTLRNLNIAHGYHNLRGGALLNSGGFVEIDQCRFLSNSVLAANATWFFGAPSMNRAASPGFGGALCNDEGMVSIRRTTFTWNRSRGGEGAVSLDGLPYWAGTNGLGGAIFNGDQLTIQDSTFNENQALGGRDIQTAIYGGNGLGGAICNTALLALTNCTFHANAALGAMGQGEIQGQTLRGGFGGALCQLSGATVAAHVTIARNQAMGSGGGLAEGGNIYVASETTVLLANSIVAYSVGAPNCFGILTDGGHNLSSDDSCAFTGPGSLNRVDPKLRPLADNGGSTRTMGLLLGSPAINTGDPLVFPPTDQRGVARPQGPRGDIGAYESSLISISRTPQGQLRLVYDTSPGSSWTLQASSNFVSWTDLDTQSADSNGQVIFNQNRSASHQSFRLISSPIQ